MTPSFIKYHWLLGSLCLWLLCAWITQQPGPARKARPKAVTTKSAHPAATRSASRVVAPQTATPGSTTGVVQPDPETGLAMDKNLMLVKGNCTACHSSKLILQSHFDREKWVERIRWMQRTQKLWDLGESEPAILTYLTTYYGPLKTPFDGRRLPLQTPVWYKQTGR